MKSIFASSAALILGLFLSFSPGDADAKRLGGGKSSGMQREAVAPQKAAPNNTATPAQNAAAPTQGATGAANAAQPKRSWMGPLAGLAAGLGLAALASYLGFGEELATMLLIGLAVVAVLAVVGFLMRRKTSPETASGLRYASAGAPMREEPSLKQSAATATPTIGSGLANGQNTAQPSLRRGSIPSDFDTAAFVRSAKVNFIRLQAANDAGNLDDLRDFTSPEMFGELQLDIADRGNSKQVTEVLAIEAEVIDVVEESSRYVVSVRFTGQVREEVGAAPNSVDEIWHMTKPRDGSKGWIIAGIQQVS